MNEEEKGKKEMEQLDQENKGKKQKIEEHAFTVAITVGSLDQEGYFKLQFLVLVNSSIWVSWSTLI